MKLTTEQKQTYIAFFSKTTDKDIIDELESKIDKEWLVIKTTIPYEPYQLLINNVIEDTFSIDTYNILKNVLLMPQYKVGEKVECVFKKYGKKRFIGTITEISLNEHSLIGAWVSVKEDSEAYGHYLMPIEDIKHIEV